MKKILIILLILSFSIFPVFSFGKKEKKTDVPGDISSESMQDSNSVFESADNESSGLPPAGICTEDMEITGLVERGFRNRISIVENPSSKSRVSYYPDAESASELEEYLGKTVTVTGRIRETGNPFKKEIEITGIK